MNTKFYAALRNYCTRYGIDWRFDTIQNPITLIWEVLRVVNALTGDMEELQKAMQDLIDSIEGTVEQKVLDQLQEWLADGTLETLINQALFNQKADKIDLDTLEDYVYNTMKYIFSNNELDHTEMLNTAFSSGGKFALVGRFFINDTALQLKSNTYLDLENATLELIPSNKDHAYVINIKDTDNVFIKGGEIIGDRDTHLKETGEWAHGINIERSQNVTLQNVTIRNTFGDGVYIGQGYDGTYNRSTKNIFIHDIIIDRASRNGISVCDGRNIRIINPYITNVDRTLPKAAIDIEPEGNQVTPNHANDVFVENLISVGCGTGFVVQQIFMNQQDFNIKVDGLRVYNGDYGVLFSNSGVNNKGLILLKDIQTINTKYSGISIMNVSSENTPKIKIENVNIKDFNSSQSTSLQYASGIVIYADNTRETVHSFIGNVEISDITIQRNNTWSGTDTGIYVDNAQGNGNIRKVIIENIKEITGSYDTLSGKIYAPTHASTTEWDVLIVDPYEKVKLETSTNINLNQHMYTVIESTGTSALTHNVNGVTRKDPSKIKFINNTDQELKLNMNAIVRPFNQTAVKSTGKGSFITLVKKGNEWYVLEMVGTWTGYSV